MSKYLLTLVLFFFGANGFAVEPPIDPPRRPIKELSIKERLSLYDKVIKIDELVRELYPHDFAKFVKSHQALLDIAGLSREDMDHLQDVHELHQQVELEMTMSKVLEVDREPTEMISNGGKISLGGLVVPTIDPIGTRVREHVTTTKSTKTTKVIENQKYLYEIGYEFKIQAANGSLQSHVVKDRQSLWGKAVYLVKNPHEEDIMMQESQITNWKREE